MNPDQLDWLQRQMCRWALELVGYPHRAEHECYTAMLREPPVVYRWWEGVFAPNIEEENLLDTASKAIASGNPLPPLKDAQKGRLALRLRLASRIVRHISSRQARIPRGWFPSRLSKMSQRELVEWTLVHGWKFAVEIFDESLDWSDQTPGYMTPLAPPYTPDQFSLN